MATTISSSSELLPDIPIEKLLIILQLHLRKQNSARPGYYGVDGKRYFLEKPTYGKFAGWLFLKTGSDYKTRMRLLVHRKGDPDDKYIVDSDQGRLILAKIIADPIECMQEYARITGECGVCGRKLECPISVKFGIGPRCLNRLMSQ